MVPLLPAALSNICVVRGVFFFHGRGRFRGARLWFSAGGVRAPHLCFWDSYCPTFPLCFARVSRSQKPEVVESGRKNAISHPAGDGAAGPNRVNRLLLSGLKLFRESASPSCMLVPFECFYSNRQKQKKSLLSSY